MTRPREVNDFTWNHTASRCQSPMCTRPDDLFLVAARESFIMYSLSNGQNRGAAKRTPVFLSSLCYARVFGGSRARSCGCVIRCPFSHPVLVCFGNDPSAPNESLSTGRVNHLLPYTIYEDGTTLLYCVLHKKSNSQNPTHHAALYFLGMTVLR